MPRTSLRQRTIRRLDALQCSAVKQGLQVRAHGLSAHSVDELLFRCRRIQIRIRNNRCLKRGPHKRRKEKITHCLDTVSDDSLDNREFRFHFRVSRASFHELVQLLERHPAFNGRTSDGGGPRPRPKPPVHQFLVLLKHCGSKPVNGVFL